MDHRMPLELNTVLAFEGISCHIEEVIGQGSNAIVYRGWYPDSLNPELRHHVLVKELFPFHPQKKIIRAADGHIAIAPEAEELWTTHKESFEAGNRIHLKLLNDHPDMMVMGANLNSYSFNGSLYSLLGYTGGRSLQAELNKAATDLRHTAVRMIGLLDALEPFHDSGYLHLDISPDNVMMVGQGEQERLFLIDYNSARALDCRDGSYLSCKEGFSAPEVSTGVLEDIGFPADLYSVAAVFFRCIMGRNLTLSEVLRPKAPDGQDSPMLSDMPQTVSAMVAAILKKGLHTLPQRRYQSITQMRQAFQELLDRIDCVGVTHWSLWESGKRSVEELIRVNPSLRYLKDEKKLYPIRLEKEQSLSLQQYLDNLCAPEGTSGMILAQGGMGKTTLLLHTAMLLGKQYSATAPAVIYISLNGWDKSDSRYIRGQILARLRFKKDENTFDSAMHALHALLEQPLKTKAGPCPAVLLLLDGLNEIRGNIAPLAQEINELNKLSGVRILAASRTPVPELKLETAGLQPLQPGDIETALGVKGLLVPRKETILALLRTPLILSIYIQACDSGRQPVIQNEDDLMKAYMDSLLEKEIRQLPEDSPQRWQIDVALNYVLPAIAAEVKKKGRGLTQRQLLKVVKGCRKTLRSWRLQKAFPQWIGHTRDIFHNAYKADEWYAVMVHELLWQRFGMLVRDADGTYRVFHQAVSEYLVRLYRTFAARTRPGIDPVSVMAWFWCILLLFTIFATHRNNLLQEAGAVTNSYWQDDLAVSLRILDINSVANRYFADSTDDNYQQLRTATSIALRSVSEVLPDSRNDFLEELSMPDGWLLSQQKRNPEYLMGYDKGYITGDVYGSYTILPTAKEDYAIMLCTMDVVLEYHRENQMSQQEVVQLWDLILNIHRQRSDLADLIGLWFEYPKPEYVGDTHIHPEEIEQAIRTLEELCISFCEIYDAYPAELQEQVRDRLSLFQNPRSWSDGLRDVTTALPSGWEKPSWLPENPVCSYSFLHPVTLEVQTAYYDPEEPEASLSPFAWHIVCYDISREEITSYLTALETGGFPCTVAGQDTFLQATVHFDPVSLSINWSPLQTTLTLTGFDIPA